MSHPLAAVTLQAVRLLLVWALLSVLAACGGGQPPGPTILLHPIDQTVTAPGGATFSATTTSAPNWQWQISTDDGVTWTDINGATAASYTTPATRDADTGNRYRTIASNSLGTTTSHSARLIVESGVFAYEAFDYPIGERLQGLNGGTGWAGPWTVADGSGTPLDISLSGVIGSGLRYRDILRNDLITSGGAWQTDASVLRGQALRVSSANVAGAGLPVWISFLVKQAQPSSGINVATATLGTGYVLNESVMAGGIGSDTSPFIGCFLCTASGTSTPALASGSVALVLMRVDFADSGNDSLSLWINPPLNPARSLGTPAVTASSSNFADVLNGLTLAWGESRSFTFDELRIAKNRESATPFTAAQTILGTSVFFTDFEVPLPAAIDPGSALVTGVANFSGRGPSGNIFRGSMLRSATGNTVTLTLTDLPAHRSLSLDFLLAAIDGLDGSGPYPAGDFLRVTLDGVDVFRESFANSTSLIQSYLPPPGVELARMINMGFASTADSAYWLGGDAIFQLIPHSNSTAVITIRMEGTGVQDLADESWAIDNLRVSIRP